MVGTTLADGHDPAYGSHASASESQRPPATLATKTDLLSQVLAFMRLHGESVYSRALGAPVTLAFDPGPGHFHFVESGELWVASAGDVPLRLTAGDLLLLPHGEGHVMSDSREGLNAPASTFTAGDPSGQDLDGSDLVDKGETWLVGGVFRFEATPLPAVLSSLPKRIYLPGGSPSPSWLTSISTFLVEETHQSLPGSALMISRLIDLLVIRALRTWVDGRSEIHGWLGGLRDERIGRALGAMHAQPLRDWSVDSLAAIANMSRSIFAERFAETVGMPPMRYLTRWRLGLAADLLKSEGLKVTQVATRVGYGSDAAFSRAFKAQFGYPPSEARSRLDAGT